MPGARDQIFNIFVEEMSAPGMHSIHIEEGRPITVTRYMEPEDLLTDRNILTPFEIAQQTELLDIDIGLNSGATLLNLLQIVQQYRLQVAALIVGDKNHFMKWLGLDNSFRISMQSLDRSCDFFYLGMKGYVDSTMDRDKLVVLGGDTTAITMASVRLGRVTDMEVSSGIDGGQDSS